MKYLHDFLCASFSLVMKAYPRQFSEEFGQEMQVVFKELMEDASQRGVWQLARVCLREFTGLLHSILREHRDELWRIKMETSAQNSNPESVMAVRGRWDGLLAALPFFYFGIASMAMKLQPKWGIQLLLVGFVFALIGLFIGGMRGFPRWSYSYLGWSVMHAWLWMMMPVNSLLGKIPPYDTQVRLGLLSYFPLLIALGIVILQKHSLRPLRQLFAGIWQDWTLLSLAIYSFFGYVMLIYGENHHPYLLAFMAGSTLVICGAVWLFMSGRTTGRRVLALAAGFTTAWLIGWVCDNTWDAQAYYNLPAGTPEAWYAGILRSFIILGISTITLFWPALIALGRRPVKPPASPQF